MPDTVLSNLERRAIGNLSIPRNVSDLALQLRADPYAPSPSEEDVHSLLGQLEDSGLVVKLGEFESPGKAASALDRHSEGWSMPDEKAQIYESRLRIPHRRWRAAGDLWSLSTEGLDQLTGPIPDQPDGLDTASLERVLAQEMARVKDGDHSGPDASLSQHLTSEEFSAWAEAVVREHEERTGERPQMPIGGGAGYSDAYEILVLDAENQKSTLTAAAPWYMALVTVAVTDADTGSTMTEATYTGYARKSVAAGDMNGAAAGSASNANAIQFAACTNNSSVVIGFAHCAASTVGTMRKFGTCASTTVSTTQTPAQFAASAYTTSLD